MGCAFPKFGLDEGITSRDLKNQIPHQKQYVWVCIYIYICIYTYVYIYIIFHYTKFAKPIGVLDPEHSVLSVL